MATLFGKMANLTDEISTHKSIASDKMKSLITGDIVAAKVVYRLVFNFKPRATHIFATNALPHFKGGVDAGVERRMLVIPFTKTIPEKERIADLEELIAAEEASSLVSAAILAGSKAYQRGTFDIPALCYAATDQCLRILIPCVNGMPKAKSDVTLITNLSFSKNSIGIFVTIYVNLKILIICRASGVLLHKSRP